MSGKPWRWFGLIAAAVALVCIGIVLGTPFSSQGQQASRSGARPASLIAQAPPATGATPAAGTPGDENYVGAETCKGCHEEAFQTFSKTRMGRIFLHQARDSEGSATPARAVTVPGKAHVEAGGGKGKGGMITFAKNDPTPVEKRNEVCLDCHTKGARIFWKGSPHESRDVACTNCHKVMEDISPKQPARQGHRDRDLRHVPHPEAGPDDAELAHAAARRQDDVHLVPQSARLGHPGPAQGAVAERYLLHLPRGEARALPLESPAGQSRAVPTVTIPTGRTTRRC